MSLTEILREAASEYNDGIALSPKITERLEQATLRVLQQTEVFQRSVVHFCAIVCQNPLLISSRTEFVFVRPWRLVP